METVMPKKAITETLVLIPLDRKKGGSEGFTFECRIGADNYTIGQVTNKVYKNEEHPANDPKKQIWFGDTNPDFRYEYDSKDEKQNNFAMVIKNHMLVDYPGNKNLKNARFKLVDVKDQKRGEAMRIKKMGAVYNKLNNLNAAQMRDIAFRWGLDAKSKSLVDIFIELCDFMSMANGMTKGALLRNDFEMENFLKLELDKEFEYTVIAKKAIIFGIFTKEKNNFFYYNSAQVGNSEEDVVKYCKDNEQIYEGFIKKEVAVRDTMPSEVDYTKSVEDIIDEYYGIPATVPVMKQKVEKAKNSEKLVKEAASLGIKNAESLADDELKSKIKEKEVVEVKKKEAPAKKEEPVKAEDDEDPFK